MSPVFRNFLFMITLLLTVPVFSMPWVCNSYNPTCPSHTLVCTADKNHLWGSCIPIEGNANLPAQSFCSSSSQCADRLSCSGGVCVGDQGLPKGSTCTASWQCSGQLKCTAKSSSEFGTCIDYSEDGNLQAGNYCSASWQCSGSLRCYGNENGKAGVCD